MKKSPNLIFACLLATLQLATAGSITSLYRFKGGSNGSQPSDQLAYTNGKLYGAVGGGGGRSYGNLFVIDPVSHRETVLHQFNTTDGADPNGLVQCGALLYGTTYGGGLHGAGTILSFDPSTGTTKTLYDLGDDASDGFFPYGKLLCASNVLYGTTYAGPSNVPGTVFEFRLDTSVFSTLFNSSASDGRLTSLTQIDNFLLFTTYGNPGQTYGNLFKFDMTSGEATLVHIFFGGSDGSQPGLFGTIDSFVYGATYGGGASNLGVIYRIDLKTDSVVELHDLLATDICPADMTQFQGKFYGVGRPCGMPSAQTGGIVRFNPVSGELRAIIPQTARLNGEGGLSYVGDALYGAVIYGSKNNGTIFEFMP